MHQGPRNPKAIFKMMKVFKQCVFLSLICLLFFFFFSIVRGGWESYVFLSVVHHLTPGGEALKDTVARSARRAGEKS